MDGGLITLRQHGSADPGQANAGSGDGADIWSVGASYALGNNLLVVDYGQGDEVDDPAIVTDDYTVWRIGAKHNFSKRTAVYITHANVDAEDGGETDLTSLGMRHNF
jgi:predicted porin